MLATLSQRNRLTTEQIRNTWYTGMFDDGKQLQIKDQELADHCLRWSCFMARQFQRYAIELLLWCFEDAIKQGNRSIEAVIEYWERRSKFAGFDGNATFEHFARKSAGKLLKKDDVATSQAWNETVHAGDIHFEFVDEPRDDNAGAPAGRQNQKPFQPRRCGPHEYELVSSVARRPQETFHPQPAEGYILQPHFRPTHAHRSRSL
jgi:hypothetical protein